MRNALLLWIGTSFLRVCGNESATPAANVVATAPAPHGGVAAVSGNLRAEVVAQPEGRLITYVTDDHAAPVTPHRVTVTVQGPDHRPVPVAMQHDPATRAYTGRVANVTEGSYPVEVVVVPAAEAPPVRMVTAPVHVVAPPAPRAHHGGKVQVIGDHAVEVVTSRTGDVALFWMNPEGEEIPATEVNVPAARVLVGTETHVIPLRPRGAYHLGHVDVAAGVELSVELPTVVLAGATYSGVAVVELEPVATIPGVVVVAPRPAVAVVHHPVQPVIVEEPVAPVVLVGGHVPRGRANGWWRNRGVVVAPAHGPVVFAPGGGGHGGWHGGGRGGGRGRGH